MRVIPSEKWAANILPRRTAESSAPGYQPLDMHARPGCNQAARRCGHVRGQIERSDMRQRKTMLAVAAAFVLGGVAVHLALPLYAQAPRVKDPKWQYGLSFQVRAATEQNFTAATKKHGVEVYRDENNGNLIYVSDTGSIAVVAGK